MALRRFLFSLLTASIFSLSSELMSISTVIPPLSVSFYPRCIPPSVIFDIPHFQQTQAFLYELGDLWGD